jgi:polyisoprenoid-binding protein YceI
MKHFILIILSVVSISVNAQVFSTSTGNIDFVSATKFEEFSAKNNQVSAAVSADKGVIQFKVPVNSFQFEKALMQSHFQENYMESATFPNSTFKGKIKDLSAVKFNSDGVYEVVAEGTLEMHGVSKEVVVPGKITVKGTTVNLQANFSILCSDYGIKIPKNNVNQISNSIALKVNCDLAPKKKK